MFAIALLIAASAAGREPFPAMPSRAASVAIASVTIVAAEDIRPEDLQVEQSAKRQDRKLRLRGKAWLVEYY